MSVMHQKSFFAPARARLIVNVNAVNVASRLALAFAVRPALPKLFRDADYFGAILEEYPQHETACAPTSPRSSPSLCSCSRPPATLWKGALPLPHPPRLPTFARLPRPTA